MNICVPILNGYDKLQNLLVSIATSDYDDLCTVYVYNNGHEPFQLPLRHDNFRVGVIYPHSGKNDGVAKSWNYFLNHVEYPKIISNHDITFAPDTIRKFRDAYENDMDNYFFCPKNIAGSNAFSCFMPTEPLVNKIGLFDEFFYPAYFEDNDYYRRMELAGYSIQTVDTDVEHDVSSTIREYTKEEMQNHHRLFVVNRQYYINKWGGLPHQETYKTPFNRNEQ